MELPVRPQLLSAQQEGKVVDDSQAVGSQWHLRALQLPPHLKEQDTGEKATGAQIMPTVMNPGTLGRCSSRILLLTML